MSAIPRHDTGDDTISAAPTTTPIIEPSGAAARFLPELTHLEAIERGLRVMDTTALSLCMDNHVPIYVFELAEGNIVRIASGERIGTIVTTPKEA